MEDKRKKLYDNLSADYDMGDYADFSNAMNDAQRRRKLYDNLVSDGYDMPDFNTFSQDMGATPTKSQQAPQQETQPRQDNGTWPGKQEEDNEEKQPAEKDAEAPETNGATSSYKEYVQQDKKEAAQVKTRLVPENANIIGVVPTEEMIRQYPELQEYREEQVYINKNTGLPVFETKNDAGELARRDIMKAGDSSNEVHREPAALVMPEVLSAAPRIPLGQLDKEVDKYIKEAYGEQWDDKNTTFQDKDGNPLTREQIRAGLKQSLFDQYTKEMEAVRNSLMFQDDETKKETIAEMARNGNLPAWMDEKSALDYVNNSTKEDKSNAVSRMILELQRRLGKAQERFVQDSKEIDEQYKGETGTMVSGRTNQAQVETAMLMHPNYMTDKETVAKLKEQIANLEAVRDELDGNMGLGNQLKHAMKTSGFFKPETWMMGVPELMSSGTYLNIGKKLKGGEKLTDNEAAMVQALSTGNNVDALKGTTMSDSYKILEGTLVSMPFTAQFMLGGEFTEAAASGIGKGVVRSAERAILSTAGKGATKAFIKGMEKASEYMITKAFGIGTKVLTEGLVMSTTVGGAKTLGEAAKRNVNVQDDGDGNLKHQVKSYGQSLAEALTDQMIENGSEFAGEYMSGTRFLRAVSKTKLGGKLGVRDFTAWVLRSGRSDFMRDIVAIQARMGMHGVIGEWNEENLGTLVRGIIGLDGAKVGDLLDADQQKQTIGTVVLQCLVTGTAATTVHGAKNGVHYAVNLPNLLMNNRNVARWSAKGAQVFGEEWTNIQSRIDLATTDRIADIVTEYTNDEALSGEQKEAAINYALNIVKQRGTNLAAAKMESLGITEDEWTIRKRQAYLEGYNAEDGEKHKAQTDLQDKEQALADLLGGKVTNLDEASDRALQDMGETRPELKQAVREYMDARDRYDGVIGKAREIVDDAARGASEEADKRTDKKNGKVRRAVKKGANGASDYEVFIVDGNVARNDDGTVNVSESDDMILYYDPTTRKVENGDATVFATIDEEQDAQEYKAARVAEAKKTALDEVTQSIDHPTLDLEQALPQQENATEETEGQTEESKQAQQEVDAFPYEEIVNSDGDVVPASVRGVSDTSSAFVTGVIGTEKGKGSDRFAVTVVDGSGKVRHTSARRDEIVFGDAVSLEEYKQTLGAAAQEIAEQDTDNAQIPAEEQAEKNANMPEEEKKTEAASEKTKQKEGSEAEIPADAPMISDRKDSNNSSTGNGSEATLTFEDGTPVPMTKDSKGKPMPDFSRMSAEQAAELYDNTFGDQAKQIVDNNLTRAEKAVTDALNMKVDGETWSEQVESKKRRDSALKRAQEEYDRASAVAEKYEKRVKANAELSADKGASVESPTVEGQAAQTADDSVGKADMDNGNDVKLSAKKKRALETVSVSSADGARGTATIAGNSTNKATGIPPTDATDTKVQTNLDNHAKTSEKNETVPEEAADKFSKKHKRKNKGNAKNSRQPKKKTYRDADGNWNTRQLIADTAIDTESIGEDMMPQSLKKAFGRVAKMLGVRIQFLDLASVDTEGDMPNGWYSGRDRGEGYENGTVYLSNNPAKAVEFVFGHEMTHEIKNSDAAAYERLKAMARSMMGGAVWSQRMARARALYDGTKGYDSEEDFEEEVVADFIGMMVNDGNMIEDIARRAGHPVLSALVRAVEKVKQWFTGDFYGRMMDRVQDTIERAMSGDAVEQESGDRFSLRQEEGRIIADAKANGTYMKAPNGEPTQLNERQWAQVRTKAFKNWFGDWEKPSRIEKLRKSDPVVITGKEITPSEDLKEYKKNALEYGKSLRAQYKNKDTGAVIQLGKTGVKEVLNHDYKNVEQLQSIAAIPQIIENAIYIGSEENTDPLKNKDVSLYHYYVCGLKIGGMDYTVRAVVAEQPNGNRYYDHKLSGVEKTKVLDSLFGTTPEFNQEPVESFGTTPGTSPTTLNGYKDKKLVSILQTNSSKVVDENGEPLVMIHNTAEKDITVFKKGIGNAIYFADAIAQNYVSGFERGSEDYEVFLNIRHPYTESYEPGYIDLEDGVDGVFVTAETERGTGHAAIVAEPNQIKSATDNVGTFDADNNDIRYSLKGSQRISPEIANTPVNIVDADEKHGFKNYAEAREWAKKNIVRLYSNEETGGKGEINISNTAIGKYLSEKAVKKSANKDVHMSVLKVLPSVLCESVDAIQHGDRKKIGKNRSEENGINPDVMMHRCYGAVNIGGKTYGVKITLKENIKTKENTKLYSYEATKIELLDGQSEGVTMTPSRNSNNSITIANILKGFETSKENSEEVDGEGQKFSLRQANERFNEELDRYANGKMKTSEMLHLGKPHGVMRMFLPDLPIVMRQRILTKGSIKKHNVAIDAFADMPVRLAQPIFVFQRSDNALGVLTEMKDRDGKNVCVAIELNKQIQDGGDFLEVNDIRSVHGRDVTEIIYPIIQNGTLKWVDKEKGLAWLSSASQYVQQETVKKDLDSAAKLVKDFGKTSVSPKNLHDEPKFSLRSYSKFQEEMEQWLRRNRLPEHAQRPTPPQRMPNETTAQFAARVNKFLAEDALWQTAPVYRGHLFADGTAMGEYNRELQRRSVLARITLQDSMLPVRKAQEAIAKEHGLHRMGIFEDAYLAETRSHGMAKNQMEQFNTFFLEPLRKAYHELSRKLGGYDKVKVYMMAKHGLERNRVIAFRDALAEDYDKEADREAQYNAYMGDMNRIDNDSKYAAGKIDYQTYTKTDDRIRSGYAPSYNGHRYDGHGTVKDYAGLTALFPTTPDFEIAADRLVRETEDGNTNLTDRLWNAVNDATKKILRSSYEAGMMTKQNYDYVNGMYSHYIPLRGWEGTNADQVWDYVKGGRGNNSQTLRTAHGRKSIADDPVATITQMAESGFIINNKNIVKQHLLRCAQNHPTSLLTVSKAWYIKTRDAYGNTVWVPASPNIPADVSDPAVVQKALEDFETNMKNLEQSGGARTRRGRLDIEYPQDNGEKREHEVRVMVDGNEMVIYVNGDPQLAQAMNNSRGSKVRQGIEESKFESAMAKVGRFQSAVYTSLSPLFIPSNYFRDLTMTLASTAIREDVRYNGILRKNMLLTWGTLKMVKAYQSGKLRRKIDNGQASKTEEMFYDYMMLGGETGFVSSTDLESYKKRLQEQMKDLNRSSANPKKVWHNFLEGVETVNRAIEASNRFAVYKTSVEYGRSREQAVNDAKDVTLNFNRKGTGEHGWQTVRNMYLFINPAIQSLQTLGALAKKTPVKFTAVTALWLLSGVVTAGLNTMLLSLFGDDDDKDKYWKFSKWDRRNNLILWVPGTKNFVKIPLSQEFRGFYGLGDMVANMWLAPDEYRQTWEDYASDTMGQIIDLLPLDPTGYDGNMLLSLAPNAIRPLFELAFNVDFTGKPIFRNSDNNKYDPNFTKAYAGTPHLLVMASKWANSIGNDYPDVQQNAADRIVDPRFNPTNPAVMDHLLKGYLGGTYSVIIGTVSAVVKGLTDAENFKVADIPLVSKFVANPDDRPVSRRQGDEFWELKEKQDRTANTLRKLKGKAKEDGDFSDLEKFYSSEDYASYKEAEPRMKQYEEDRKKEKLKETGEEDTYKPKKKTCNDVYRKHATSEDDFEDMKMDMLWKKVKSYKDAYDVLDNTVSERHSSEYYKKHRDAIEAAEDVEDLRKDIAELKKGFLDGGDETFDKGDMEEIRTVRKEIIKKLDAVNRKMIESKGK